jgi:predicted component of type VI protein secretion system
MTLVKTLAVTAVVLGLAACSKNEPAPAPTAEVTVEQAAPVVETAPAANATPAPEAAPAK